jgi:hypothetical protein
MLRRMVDRGASRAGELEIAPRRAPQRRTRRGPGVSGEARLARILLTLAPIVTLLVLFGPRFLLNSGPVKRDIAVKLAEQVATRSKASVRRLGGVTFGWAYQPCLQASEIYRVRGQFEVSAKTSQACVDRWPSAVGSGFRAVRVKLARPSIRLAGGRKSEGGDGGGSRTSSAARALGVEARAAETLAPLREMQIVFDDLRLDWEDMPLPKRIATGGIGPIDGWVTLQQRGRQSAASIEINEPITGMRIRGRANPTSRGWDVDARVEGDLAPSFGELLSAAGLGLDIKSLPVLGEIGLTYDTTNSRVTVDVDMRQLNVDVANRLVSSKRLGFEAHQKLRLNVDLAQQHLWVEDGLIEVNGIPGSITADVQLGGAKPSFSIKAELPTVSMLKLLRAIPGTELPKELEGMSSSALFALSFEIAGELRDPTTWEPKLEHRLVGVGAQGKGSGLEYVNGPFTYYPLTKTGRSETGRPAGPGTETWIPYARIPYAQRRAIQVSEDANFFVHNGVDIEEIKSAMVEGLTTDQRARGGSTLSQQLVKNLLLSRERTAMRKVQEMVLTFLVESALSKDQIFELYMNIIEWGPNIYGLQEASYYYFAKSPGQLSFKEQAYLASVIPGPILYHKYFEENSVPPKHLGKINFLLKRLRKLDTIKSDAALSEALDERIRFTRRGAMVPVKQAAPTPAPVEPDLPDGPDLPDAPEPEEESP